VQQLSGVATLTRQYVDAVAGTQAKIYDTRKTIPGLRQLQKYAVRCGGGENHRMGLYDAVLIKDNHIAVVGGVTKAVALARAAFPLDRQRLGGGLPHGETSDIPAPHLTSPREGEGSQARDTALPPTIIVECDTLPQVEEAIAARADIILLDNMDNAMLREAVGRIYCYNQVQGTRILSEASGNVSLATVRAIAETGVDRISVGKLTHSAVAVDIGLDEV
jgi:nicotinate-nucleotide pyrophosphorylase (carboxylating)